MSSEIDLRNASPEIVSMLHDAVAELANRGFNLTPEKLVAIRQRQATGEVHFDDPPITTAESPTRSVMVKTEDAKFVKVEFDRDKTPGLSPMDSAVRKMRSAAYAFNEEDYTAAAIMAREAFLEVQAALADKTFMDVDVEMVKPELPKGEKDALHQGVQSDEA